MIVEMRNFMNVLDNLLDTGKEIIGKLEDRSKEIIQKSASAMGKKLWIRYNLRNVEIEEVQ